MLMPQTEPSQAEPPQKLFSASAFEFVVSQRTRIELNFSISYQDMRLLVQELVSRKKLRTSYCWGLLPTDGILCHMLLRVVSWVLPPVIPLVIDVPKFRSTFEDRALNMPEDETWLEKQISPTAKHVAGSVMRQVGWEITKRLMPVFFVCGSIGVYTLSIQYKDDCGCPSYKKNQNIILFRS